MIEGMRPLMARLAAVKQGPTGLPRDWAVMTVAGAKRDVRVKTGTTRRTIRIGSVSDDGATVTVGAAGPYLERGTRPHIIRPRKAKLLRFPAAGVATTRGGRPTAAAVRQGGAYVFARVVRHPGTKPYPFLLPNARKALQAIGIGKVVAKWNQAA